MKQFYGADTYVQSAGVKNDLEIDGFAITVCAEIGVELSRHRSRNFAEMEKFGDPLSSFDMVIALSPASRREAEDLTRFFHLDLEYWPITDPGGQGETREERLAAYRKSRDEIIDQLIGHWGPPRSDA